MDYAIERAKFGACACRWMAFGLASWTCFFSPPYRVLAECLASVASGRGLSTTKVVQMTGLHHLGRPFRGRWEPTSVSGLSVYSRHPGSRRSPCTASVRIAQQMVFADVCLSRSHYRRTQAVGQHPPWSAASRRSSASTNGSCQPSGHNAKHGSRVPLALSIADFFPATWGATLAGQIDAVVP